MRDYRIVLMEHLDDMSWRYFLVLMNNLSPYGSVAMHIRAAQDGKNVETTEEKDERDANQFFSSILSV